MHGRGTSHLGATGDGTKPVFKSVLGREIGGRLLPQFDSFLLAEFTKTVQADELICRLAEALEASLRGRNEASTSQEVCRSMTMHGTLENCSACKL